MNIEARSKWKSNKNNVRLYYILAFGFFVFIISFALTNRNILLSLSMALSFFAGFIILRQEPYKLSVNLDSIGLHVDDDTTQWNNVLSWSMIDMGDTIEFVINTTNFTQPYFYFYIPDSSPALPQLIQDMAQFAPYNEDMPSRDIVHKTLRFLELI